MAMMAPSNSVPRPVLMVVGEKDFQMMLSHTLVALIADVVERLFMSPDFGDIEFVMDPF